MECNLLVGNGINIQFVGVNACSSSAIMSRVVENIKSGKYTALTENSLSVDEQLVTISRPTAYGEYAPYHFVNTEQEFKTLVIGLRPQS